MGILTCRRRGYVGLQLASSLPNEVERENITGIELPSTQEEDLTATIQYLLHATDYIAPSAELSNNETVMDAVLTRALTLYVEDRKEENLPISPRIRAILSLLRGWEDFDA